MSIEKILKGDIRAAAHLMREIEEGIPSARKKIVKLLPYTGGAHIIGITGSPGTGKSTLLDRLVHVLRERNQTVGVVVIDPTSPFTGGAILGDRVRMQRHTTDPGVFIRSLASRGCLGGLSNSTFDVVSIMDAMGKDIVIVETVGSGQDNVEISRLAHSNIVVTIPGTGDGVQAIKAGILESGDIFAVNKADLPSADLAAAELEMMLNMKTFPKGGWKPPVVLTAPLRNRGIMTLLQEIDRHRSYLKDRSWSNQKENRVVNRFLDVLQQQLFEETITAMRKRDKWEDLLASIRQGKTDPYKAAETVIAEVIKN